MPAEAGGAGELGVWLGLAPESPSVMMYAIGTPWGGGGHHKFIRFFWPFYGGVADIGARVRSTVLKKHASQGLHVCVG